jgi:hypothetical protein
MSERPSTGLAGFMQPDQPKKAPEPAAKKPKKTGIALTVRLSASDYERVGHFLVSNRAEYPSFQRLALEGINRIFQERGMKPLK